MSQKTSHHTDVDRERLCLLRKLGLDLRSFYDVGASNGCWSQRVSAAFPQARFDLFEPLIDHAPAYRELMENILRQHPQFHLHKVALGPECKRTHMIMFPNLVGSTALPMSHCPAECQRVEIEMITIDQAVRDLKLPVPQVIKADTQGCELTVLQGAVETLEQVDVLLLECWMCRSYGGSTPLLFELANWLRDFDFHLWDFGDPWRDADGTLVAQDCFFLNARSKVSRLKKERRARGPQPPGRGPSRKGRSWLNKAKSLWQSPGRRAA